MTNLKNKIGAELRQEEIEELVEIWNSFCADTGKKEGFIYPNTSENIIALFDNAWDAVQHIEHYDRDDVWFTANFYGDIESFSNVMESPISIRRLVDWLASK